MSVVPAPLPPFSSLLSPHFSLSPVLLSCMACPHFWLLRRLAQPCNSRTIFVLRVVQSNHALVMATCTGAQGRMIWPSTAHPKAEALPMHER